MATLYQKYAALKTRVGGNRELFGYEETFGMPREEQQHITPPARHIIRILAQCEFAIRLSESLDGKYDGIVESGQIRHLPKGEAWQQTFVPVAPGEYQNGACWATAIHWFCDAIGWKDPALAARTVRDAICYFEKYGVFECVNGNYRKLDTFVASAVNTYAAAKKWLV